MIGKVISHFKILVKLGEGGMGVVYKAHDNKLNRTVALKFLPSSRTANETDKARFLQEAQAAGAINHANVCVIYDIIEHEDQQMIVMEYVEGVTLSEKIKSGPLELKTVIDYAMQIGEGLKAAHAKGIVHRDIKSSNIMVTDTNQIKVMDFGLAKLRGSTKLTKTTSTIGTLAYMSPEHLQNKDIDARTDIFSFGVVLYEMLTGELPFKGDYDSALMYSIVNDEPEPVSKFRSDVSSEFMHIMNRVLEKDPEDRYLSVKDMLVELKRVKRDSDRVVKRAVPPAPDGEVAEQKPTEKVAEKKSKRWVMPVSIFSILILTVGIVLVVKPFSKTTMLPMRTVPFTSSPGDESEPAFSPDGNQIAFRWKKEGSEYYNLYVKIIGTVESDRITDYQGNDSSPVWSPDGKSLAFIRSSEGVEYIYKVPARGGSERKLIDKPWDRIRNLCWTMDNKFIVLSARESNDSPYCIYRIALETMEIKKITSPPKQYSGDSRCAVSSNNKQIAFLRDMSTYAGDIYVVPIGGGMPEPVTSLNSWIRGLTWRNNREIIFSSDHAGIHNLWKLSTSEKIVEQVASSSSWLLNPTISNQGNHLAYEERNWDTNIHQVDLLQKIRSDPTIINPSTHVDAAAQFSPDGNQITFMSNRSGSWEIWVCDKEGNNSTSLTNFGGPLTGTPKWSPDGRMVAFDSRYEGQVDVFVANVEGGSPKRITFSESGDRVPCWSADGRWIYFASDRNEKNQIWKISATGGDAVQVTSGGGFAPQVSFDGDWIYYTRSRTSEIWKIPSEGGSEIMVSNVVVHWSIWDLTKEGIYHFYNVDKIVKLGFLDFSTGLVEEILDIGEERVSAPEISPNGRWLIYEQEDQSNRDIVIVENFR
ncbi:hypothetical protein BVY01_00865 [bacterium I07]|nr:hypothetical protein BVY01_00865 [bacterium I07]